MLLPQKLTKPKQVSLNYFQKLFRNRLFGLLSSLKYGAINISEDGKSSLFGSSSTKAIELSIHDPRFFQAIALGGSIGAGESYFLGEWECSDLLGLLRLLIQNMSLVERMESGFTGLNWILNQCYRLWRTNRLSMSQQNIAFHYDLSNDFFKLFLDPTMMYSSAIFPTENASLEEASQFKLKTICEKLNLQPSDHLLEIGTGWGGFALYAAQHYGCKITTTTISQAQYTLAKERIRHARLENQIELLCQDYRELKGRFDKIVSIEMLEAVGHQYYAPFFEQCNKLLKPEGICFIQTITISDQYYEQAKKNVDFIQRYIFPGGCLPSVTILLETLTHHTGLRLVDLEDIGQHYALTLHHWRDRFWAAYPQINALGFDDRFIRLWEYYLTYCEAGFLEKHLSNMQMILFKKR